MQKDALLPSGLVALVCAVPCPASPGAVSLASTTASVPVVMPAALVWHTAGPSEVGPAALCLGEMQKILG